MNFNKKVSFLTLGTVFAMLVAGAFIKSEKVEKTYALGDIDPNGGVIVKTGVDTSSLIKFKPSLSPTDPYYTGALKADDPLYETGKQYYQNVSMDNVGDIESAWDYYTGKGVTIAVIDSGIEHDHEDFEDISNKSAFFETNINTGNVTIKDVSTYGWSVLSHDQEEDYYGDLEWVDHGSNVSGSAAASKNNKGTVGIAPEATILALKIDFYDESINAAIKYAADNGADVINMSLGGYDSDDHPSGESGQSGTKTSFKAAIDYAYSKGVIVIAAAGNEKSNAHSFPACNEHVIGVGALAPYSDAFDNEYSNFNKDGETSSGNHNVDILAPGSVVAPGITDPYEQTKSLGYHFTSGTSFSSPIVAGAAALWLEKYNGTPDEFEEDLYASAYKPTGYNFTQYGNGNLDVYNLLDIEHEGITVSKRNLDLDTSMTSASVSATSDKGTITSWESNDPAIVTVNGEVGTATANATISVVGAGSTTVTVRDSNGLSADITVNVAQYVPVTGISVSSTVEVNVKKTVSLNASILPTNATHKEISYSSSNTSIATVSNSGDVTGVAEGSATITLVAENNISNTVTVTVSKAQAQTYKIVFNSGTDKSTAYSDLEDAIASGGDIIDFESYNTDCHLAYPGKNGVKLGNSNSFGYMTFKLKEELEIYSITVKACYYGNDSTAKLYVDNQSVDTLTDTLTDYKFEYDGSLTDYFDVSSYKGSKKRIYVSEITIVTGSDEPVPPTPTPTPSKSGCNGGIESTSIILSILAISGVSILFIRKRKYN